MFEILSSYEVKTLIAATLIALGARLVVHGAVSWWRKGDALEKVVGFRRGIAGLATVGIAVWLLTGQFWVLILSLAVAGEELFETSVIIAALRHEKRQRAERDSSERSRQPAPVG